MISSDLLEGKIAVFRFPGEQAVMSKKDAMLFRALENEFRNDSTVIFVNIFHMAGDTSAGGLHLLAGKHYTTFKKYLGYLKTEISHSQSRRDQYIIR